MKPRMSLALARFWRTRSRSWKRAYCRWAVQVFRERRADGLWRTALMERYANLLTDCLMDALPNRRGETRRAYRERIRRVANGLRAGVRRPREER